MYAELPVLYQTCHALLLGRMLIKLSCLLGLLAISSISRTLLAGSTTASSFPFVYTLPEASRNAEDGP